MHTNKHKLNINFTHTIFLGKGKSVIDALGEALKRDQGMIPAIECMEAFNAKIYCSVHSPNYAHRLARGESATYAREHCSPSSFLSM
jgi:hypothetical protein